MKLYKGLMGAAGVAVSLGLFAYAGHDAVYEESETEEFTEENPEYAPELPAEKAAPYAQEDDMQESEEHPKIKQNSSEDKKKERRKNLASRPSLLKSNGLEYILEEEERAEYDLSVEERIIMLQNLPAKDVMYAINTLYAHYQRALDADDFKVAVSYITDFKKATELKNPGGGPALAAIETNLAYGIILKYDRYLSSVVEDCGRYDFDSVFRKIMWMNLFMIEHQDAFAEDKYVIDLSLATLLNKGNQALEAVEYCIEKKAP